VTAPPREESARLARWTLGLALAAAVTTALAFASAETTALAVVGFIAGVTGLLIGIAAWAGPGARVLAATGAMLNLAVVCFWVAALLALRD
jgi:hypothetical protein